MDKNLPVRTVQEVLQYQIAEYYERVSDIDVMQRRYRFYQEVLVMFEREEIEDDRNEDGLLYWRADHGCGLWIMQLILTAELLADRMDDLAYPSLAKSLYLGAAVMAYG